MIERYTLDPIFPDNKDVESRIKYNGPDNVEKQKHSLNQHLYPKENLLPNKPFPNKTASITNASKLDTNTNKVNHNVALKATSSMARPIEQASNNQVNQYILAPIQLDVRRYKSK